MRTRSPWFVTAIAAALFLFACGDDNTGGDVDARPVDAATTDTGIPDGPDTDAPDVDAGIDAAPDAMVDAPIDAMPTPSEAIGFVRAASGAVNLPVTDVTVTYIKPVGGTPANDPAGFTVQAEQMGPAVMIAVDPASLSPVPEVGDVVSFTVTNVMVSAGQPRATAITDWTRTSQGADVGALAQDVTAATDLVTALGDYDSEIIDVSADVAANCAGAGSGFEQCQITTTGITTPANSFTVRLPTTLQATVDLTAGCDITLDNTPVHRFNSNAQLTAFVAADISVSNCPAPTVLAALSTSSTTVDITFTRNVTNVNPDGSQFTFDNGLMATAASVNGRVVTVTTSSQTSGAMYIATVDATVTDTYNTPVGMPNTGMFTGFIVPMGTHLLISEVKTGGTSEFIEIYNPTAVPVDLRNYYLTDHQSYFLLPGVIAGTTGMPSVDATDFLSRFPAGAMIGPQQVITIALDAVAFEADYASAPTYSLEEVGNSTAMESVWGSASGRGLTNNGELVALFFWDGATDTVKDVDIVLAGNNTSAINNLIAKTPVDGPDADTDETAYATDALTIEQFQTGTTGANTYKRIRLETGFETQAGTGNGISGDDETSEMIRTTWDSQASSSGYTAGTPGAVPASLAP